MEQNNLFHDRYFLERLLGRGNFSEVWLAKDTKTDIMVALKIYAPATGLDDSGLNVFAREFSLVVNANHKNLLKPLYYDTCDRKPYLVLPYCERGSLMKEVGQINEKDAWQILRDVSSGLSWLHNMNPAVIHQDIKPDNIMIGENGEYLITDFGVSTHLRSTLRKSMSSAFSSAGTIAYMAPERFGADNTPIMANDIYSLGATVYELLAGDTPFGDDGGLVQKKGAEVPILKGEYSEQLKKTLTKCLKANPWERPTAEQLEKYAETALEGKSIKFADEKTAWQKFKWIFIAAGVLVIAGIVLGIVFISKNAKERAEKERIEAIQRSNYEINARISALVISADSLLTIGDMHDEGYETSYIGAYSLLKQAIAKGSELQEGATVKDQKAIDTKMGDLTEKLNKTYYELMDKANMFTELDEEEVAADFRNRAANISSIIEIVEELPATE